MSERDEWQTGLDPRNEPSEEARLDSPAGPASEWQGYDPKTLNTILDG
jgi:hypothetical protein